MTLSIDTRTGIPSSRRSQRGISQLVLTLAILALANAWALQYIFAKMMGDRDVPIFGSLLIVHLVMASAFYVLLFCRRQFFTISLWRVRFFLLAACLGNIISLGAELLAARYIPAGLLTLIVAMTPLFTFAFTMLLRTEAVSRRRIAGLILGVIAAAIILMPEAASDASGILWIVVAFLAPASFAGMAVFMWSSWPKGLHAQQVAFGNATASLVLLLPLAILEGGDFGALSLGEPAGFALVGFALTLMAEYWLFAHITRRGGAIFASCADFGAIAFGLLWAFLLLSEIPTFAMVAAGMPATGSMLAMNQSRDR